MDVSRSISQEERRRRKSQIKAISTAFGTQKITLEKKVNVKECFCLIFQENHDSKRLWSKSSIAILWRIESDSIQF